METYIVDGNEPVTLVGGGALEVSDLVAAVALAPRVVAADGGADSALKHGVTPDVVVGDFDSISPAARAELGVDRLLYVAEQDTTDFDKALRRIMAPVVLAVGFLGGRLDHQLAALNVLVQPHPSPCILVGEHEILFHLQGRVDIPCDAGDVVSLFPMQCVEGQSEGLQWPINGLRLDPMQQTGTSNRAEGPIRLEAQGPGMIVILPKRHLISVMQNVIRQSQR